MVENQAISTAGTVAAAWVAQAALGPYGEVSGLPQLRGCWLVLPEGLSEPGISSLHLRCYRKPL